MRSHTDEEFFRDTPLATPYDDNSTSHPSLHELTNRFARRTAFPQLPSLQLQTAHGHNPHTVLDVLYHTQRDVLLMRDLLA